MKIQTLKTTNGVIAVISGAEKLILDPDSAMELVMRYLSTQSATAPVHGSNMKPARKKSC